jgi:hypothetical protein
MSKDLPVRRRMILSIITIEIPLNSYILFDRLDFSDISVKKREKSLVSRVSCFPPLV